MTWFDIPTFLNSFHIILSGIGNTLLLSTSAIASGLVIGMAAGLAGASRHRLVSLAPRLYVEIFRNIPAIVLIFWMYYALPVLIGWQADRFTAALLALALYAGSYSGEIWRSGLMAIGRNQHEAAAALGFGSVGAMRWVILPQALRAMFPSFVSMAIDTTKMSSVASVIAYQELLYKGQLVAVTYYRPIEAYTGVAVIFIVIVGGFSLAMEVVERRLTRILKR